MKKFLRSMLILTLFVSLGTYAHCGSCNNNSCFSQCCDCDCCSVKPCDGYPFLSHRSQGVNAARELAGWQQFINKSCVEDTYGAFSITLEHTRSFKPEHITQFFFGNDLINCCNTLVVQGSQVQSRHPKAWLADYFGLSPEYSGCISFCPRIKNIIADVNFYLGLDECYNGLFFRIHAPITWTKWELNMSECIRNSGDTGFLEGYMNEADVDRGNLPDSFMEAMSGNIMFGEMKDPLRYGLMTNCKLTKVGIADLRASLGWNFKGDEDYHFGFFIHAAAPTGTRPKGTYLFEPIIGNGKHWELGFGITSSYIFWRSEDCEEKYLGVWLDGNFTHLFKANQCRSFDFCNRPNSRYMLLQEMGKNEDMLGGRDQGDEETTPANFQYKKSLIPAINWSTFCVDVKINFQADIVLKLGYVRENWSMDLGYNLWARTGEKFCCDCCDDCCCLIDQNKKYAIKGDSFLYGQATTINSSIDTVEHKCQPYSPKTKNGNGHIPIALSATQSCATIRGGKNYSSTDDSPLTNPCIDNAFAAYQDTSPLQSLTMASAINTSIQPLLASKKLLNIGKSPSAITHKLFWSLNYAWNDRCEDEWIPFIGIGWEVEFTQKNKGCCNNVVTNTTTSSSNTLRTKSCNSTSFSSSCNSCRSDCDDCKRAGVYQYGLWFRGGFAFN